MFLKFILLLVLLFSFTSCSSVALLGAMAIHPTVVALKKDRNFNFKQEGYAFEAIIDGVPIIELSDAQGYLSLKNYYDKKGIHWRSMRPISGAMNIELKRKYIEAYDIGQIDRKTLQISYIALPWRASELKKIEENPLVDYGGIVRIEGVVINNPRVAKDFPLKVLEEGSRLESGNYLLFMKIEGTEGWDKKEIYLEVRSDVQRKKFL